MKLFIACASSDDVPSIYYEESKKLLNIILKDNELVYGAYNKGIMDIAYNIAHENGNKITGIAPKEYESDLLNLDINEKILVDSIPSRTNKLIQMSDAIIALPGGIGTINELICAIDMKRSNVIDKPIIIFNINHYYDKLFEFLDRLYNEKFTDKKVSKTYNIANSIDEVMSLLNISK